ncbi:MAG: alpha,2-mannosyltransferase [Pseudonocardiales bacterium]|jgi:alpha-1,2-mannosyltransferase|nr:alpha,2-mannosyltransferase [Pseudonocardiales bacterium]
MATASESDVAMATGTRPGIGRRSALTRGAGAWIAVLLAIPLGLAVLLFTHYGQGVSGIDLGVYRGGAGTLLDGKPLYEFVYGPGLPFTYPPIAAVLFVPLAWLPGALALGTWTFLSVLALEVVVWLTLRHLDVTDPVLRLRWTAIFAVIGLSLDATLFNTWIGQINIFLMLLIFLDLLAPTGRFRGVAIGIAAGLKLTPLIFIGYLLFTRRFHAAATATAAFAATVLIGFAVTPKDAASYWKKYVFDVKRITLDGQAPFLDSSINRLLARLHSPHPSVVYLVLAVVVGVQGLTVAVWASRRGYELTGVMACGITGLLVSPVSWTFHWVWFVPLLVMLTVRASRGNRTGEKIGVALMWLVCLTSAWWVVKQIRDDPIPAPINHFYANWLTFAGIGALIGFALHLRRTAELPARVPEPLP